MRDIDHCCDHKCLSLFRRVVIILEIEVIKPAGEVGGKLGDPVPYNEGKALKYIVKTM